MGGTHSDYYEGETHTIQGKVMGALENAKVTLYLDDKSEPIAKADVQNDGSYVLEFTPEVHENIVKSKYALLSADGTQKSLKSIVAFYDSNSSKGYSYKDTIISGYTDAIYKIKKALDFDKATSKALAKSFINLYDKGIYKSTSLKSYGFAYNGIMDELAQNNKYSNQKVFNSIKKLSTLKRSQLEEAKRNKANKYAFVVIEKVDDATIVQEVKLNISQNLPLIIEDITYSIEKTVVGKTENYDSAKHYKFVTDSSITLKNLKISTFDSLNNTTNVNNDFELLDLSNGSKTFIIENLKLAVKSTGSSSSKLGKANQIKKQEVSGNYTAYIYTHRVEDQLTGLYETWDYVGSKNNMALRSYIDFAPYLSAHTDKHRAMQVYWIDTDGTLLYILSHFNDYDDVYANANIAARYMSQTSYLAVPSVTNNFKNEYEDSNNQWTHYGTPTHTIKDFDKIVTKDFAGGATTAWINSNYAKTQAQNYVNNEAYDRRQPLLLLHGWQAVKVHAERNPAILRDYNHNEFEYWHNFIGYYLSTPELHNKYKLYTYHYASYKHISYNGKILKFLFDDLKQNYNTVLGKALWNDKLVMIGHSMGGLVARSLIEEHQALGTSAENLGKLITLDTPHHGSHGANQAHWSSNLADFMGSKDLATAGSVDLIWDNYDSYYSKNDSTKDIANYNETLDWNDRDSRYRILGDRASFDNYFLAKIPSFTNDDFINPYLAYLNKSFRLNWASKVNSTGTDKYIFYVAHSSGDQTFGDKVSNPIDTTLSYRTTTATFNSYGYGSGGAEPVCSAFLSKRKSNQKNNVTRFEPDFNSPTDFIITNESGLQENDFIPYRYFWDYDHQSIMAGRAHNNKDWDRFIDNKDSIDSNECGLSSYYNFASYFSCGTQHYNYYLYAYNFLYNRNADEGVEKNLIYGELGNPLTTEPVFMSLHKDLLSSYKGN